MCEVISLSDYRQKVQDQKDDQELQQLWQMVDEVMDRIGDIDPEPYHQHLQTDIDALVASGIQIGPTESALLNAYYSLIYDGREDLADLVMEIMKMK